MYGILDEMYVVPAFRSLNIGSIIVEKMRAIGKDKGWKRIDVTAPTENAERAVHFYQKCGFEFTGSKLKLLL
jgi:GNAT superfamily N-acetyltransferase